MPVVEPKLTFFQMIIKGFFSNSTELGKSGFRKSPETFNPVNMGFTPYKFILSMMHSKVFFVSQIN